MLTVQWRVRSPGWTEVRDERQLAVQIADLVNVEDRGYLQLDSVGSRRAVVVRTFGGFTVIQRDVVGADIRARLQSTIWILGAAKCAWNWVIPHEAAVHDRAATAMTT